MTKSLASRLAVVAATLCALPALGAPAVLADGTCPNEQLRFENNSAGLPDCRAYELVSPDSNHGAIQSGSYAAADGDMMVYASADTPDNAKSGQIGHLVRATRDSVQGWSGVSLAPPLPEPVTAYFSFQTEALSEDLSSTLEYSDQPLSGGVVPSGKNLYLGRNATYQLITKVGTPLFGGLNDYPSMPIYGGTPDFSHVFFSPSQPQLPSDPAPSYNSYEWSEEHGLQLVGILPNGTPAPDGATVAGFSDDGRTVAFLADGKLYLRINAAQTIEIGASQRTVDPDPNPPLQPASVSVTADGSKVLFTSSSELTNDANTGESGGVATDAGRDLYSYDVASGKLTDLTVNTNPADAATGANLLGFGTGGPPILATTSDGSYIYFTATGDLASGHVAGHRSLYVSHDGRIDYIADADALDANPSSGGVPFPMSPDGQHVAFDSTERLTGYDNTDPVTGKPHYEVFTFASEAGIECASCRADGTRPTADSRAAQVNDDGSVFFQSADAVVPQATSGLQQVYEYADGKVSAISRPDGPSATFLSASASGDDVFFRTFDMLVPNPNAGDSAVYDARVDGGFPIALRDECSGEACLPAQSPQPVFGAPASSSLSGAGNPAAAGSSTDVPPKSKAKTAAQVRAEKLAKALRACKAKHNKRKRSTCEKKARRTYGRRK